MGMVSEFKEFIMSGHVMDMAVGIIIGAAFGKIVDSLVKDIIMPPIGFALGKSVRKNVIPFWAGLNVILEGIPVCNPIPVTTVSFSNVFRIIKILIVF